MNRRRNPARAVRGVGLIAGIVLLGVAAPAAAHDALSDSIPTADQVVDQALTSVTLTFNDVPLEGFDEGTIISVLDPNGTEVSEGAVSIEGTALTKAVDLPTAGAYKVVWRTVSGDGHPIAGEYSFQYTVSPTPTPSPVPSIASPTSPAPSASPSETASAAPANESATFPTTAIAIGTLVVFLVLAVIVVAFASVARARKRKQE
jgi:methionine-rich copper-binding protein CopC